MLGSLCHDDAGGGGGAAQEDAQAESEVDLQVCMFRSPTRAWPFHLLVSSKSIPSWVQRLASSFEKHGLDVVADDRIELKDIYRLMWGQSILAGVEDLAADASVIGDQEAENARVWIDRLRAEFAQGVYLDTSWVCALGRKLSSASEVC